MHVNILTGKTNLKRREPTCEVGVFDSFVSFASLEDLSISLLPMAQLHHHPIARLNHPARYAQTCKVKAEKASPQFQDFLLMTGEGHLHAKTFFSIKC